VTGELLMVEQRHGRGERAPWVLEGGLTMRGHESARRLDALRAGLVRHGRVRGAGACASDEQVEITLQALHRPSYLAALREVRSPEPIVIAALAPPGMAPDMPVCADLVAAAFEGMRTAITAASMIADGARFTYALCRPPGHHAGPDWLAGYCYLNNAAGAVWTLLQRDVKPIGVLDLDLHYPNGTSAILASMADTSLHSLHAWPVTNVAARTVVPATPRERVVEFRDSPDAATYLDAVAASVDALARSSAALVLSLGYDGVAGDPHGSWSFSTGIFAQIGRLLAGAGLPVCVIQEGGYALDTLAECSSAFAGGLLEAEAVAA
jgi:acetoin utilization deacetylase AcuC-like enzyme